MFATVVRHLLSSDVFASIERSSELAEGSFANNNTDTDNNNHQQSVSASVFENNIQSYPMTNLWLSSCDCFAIVCGLLANQKSLSAKNDQKFLEQDGSKYSAVQESINNHYPADRISRFTARLHSAQMHIHQFNQSVPSSPGRQSGQVTNQSSSNSV